MMLVDVEIETENWNYLSMQSRIGKHPLQFIILPYSVIHVCVIISLHRLTMCFEMSSARWCHGCDESISIAEGTPEFIIKCCQECFEYCDYEVLSLTVSWHDAQGHHGEATRNSDNTYTVYHTCRMIILWIILDLRLTVVNVGYRI